MRTVVKLPVEEGTERRKKLHSDSLGLWLTQEIEGALSARARQEKEWKAALALYEGRPKQEIRDLPFPKAPNIEVTLGAIAADAIYAQALVLVFQANPVLTVRTVGQSQEAAEDAKALQRWVNWLGGGDTRFAPATRQVVLDDVQLGTGIYYVPWVEEIRKTDIRRVRRFGAAMMSVAPDDFLVPGGATEDLHAARWVAMRSRLTEMELEEQGKAGGWDFELAQAVGGPDSLRAKRERTGNTETSGEASRALYEVWEVYCYYDVDGDGEGEDLLVTWDRGSKAILKVRYNPYDRRPFAIMRYQERGHLFYGLGVMEMLRPFEEEVTELHNSRTANVMLANQRGYVARTGAVQESPVIYPGKIIELSDPDAFRPFAMADVYPSASIAEALTISLAERRVGVNELSTPTRAPGRTPGITALSFLQQANQRFAPAFDGVREGAAEAMRQVLYRWQEKLLKGDADAERAMERVLGPSDASVVIRLLKADEFDEAFAVELTTSSASVSREADKQNALLLMQALAAYYEKLMQLASVIASPQVPPEVKDVAKRVAKASGEALERLLETFDQVRDPATFVVELEDEGVDEGAQAGQSGLAGILQLAGGLGEAGAGGGQLGGLLGAVPGGPSEAEAAELAGAGIPESGVTGG